MKTYLVLTLIAFQLDAFANEATVDCHPENPHAAYSLSVSPDELVIDTKEQNSKKKTYHFILKRPWESEIVSKCDITVIVK